MVSLLAAAALLPMLQCLSVFLTMQFLGERDPRSAYASLLSFLSAAVLSAGTALALGLQHSSFLDAFTVSAGQLSLSMPAAFLAGFFLGTLLLFLFVRLFRCSFCASAAAAALSFIPSEILVPGMRMLTESGACETAAVILAGGILLAAAMRAGGVTFSRNEHWFEDAWSREKLPILLILSCGLAAGILVTAVISPGLVCAAPGSSAALCIFAGTFLLLTAASMLTVFVLQLWVRQNADRKKAAAMEQWFIDSKDYMNVIRSQRHDYNLHIHALVGLIENNDYASAHAYMSRLASEASDINDIMPVNDAVLGSLLYNMREEARKRGSDISYKITYDMRDTLCSGFTCTKIIGNLLQNAIDALTTEEDRAFGIRMRIFKRRGNTVIHVENRYTGSKETIMKAFEAGFTTKEKHEGIGLAMVLRTVSREGGRIYPEFEPELLRFVVNLPNKITLEGDESPEA